MLYPILHPLRNVCEPSSSWPSSTSSPSAKPCITSCKRTRPHGGMANPLKFPLTCNFHKRVFYMQYSLNHIINELTCIFFIYSLPQTLVLQPNSDLGVDLTLESTQCFFDVYDTLLSIYTESGWCHSGTLGEIEIFKMAAAYLKHILITIISLLMVLETFSPCLVIGLVTQRIWSTMSQRHTTYGHPRWPPLTWKYRNGHNLIIYFNLRCTCCLLAGFVLQRIRGWYLNDKRCLKIQDGCQDCHHNHEIY